MEMLTVLDPVYTGAKISGFVKVFGFLVFQGYGLVRFLHCPASHSDCQTQSTTVILPILFCDFFHRIWPLIWKPNGGANSCWNSLRKVFTLDVLSRLASSQMQSSRMQIFADSKVSDSLDLYKSFRRNFEKIKIGKNITTAWKSILSLVKLQSLVVKCCKL